MVGPFFDIFSQELDYFDWLYHAIDESEAEEYGGFLGNPIGHEELFDTRFDYAPVGIEYFDFPRGRVVYDKTNGLHVIYIDRCIAFMADQIARLFQVKRYRIEADEHYVCPNCIDEHFFD